MVSCCARPTSAGQRARAGRPAQRAAPFVECHALQPDRQLGLLLCCALLQLALAHTAAAAGGCRWGDVQGASAPHCAVVALGAVAGNASPAVVWRCDQPLKPLRQSKTRPPRHQPAKHARQARGRRYRRRVLWCLRAPSGIARKAEGDPQASFLSFFKKKICLNGSEQREGGPRPRPHTPTP